MLKKEYRQHRNLLIVDDQEINRELLGTIVSDYNVAYACDGEEALSYIREHKATLSMILLDLIMPNIDGFQVLEIMKDDPDTYGEIPVVVLTSEKDAELRALKLGASDFITKPFDLHEVILTRIDRIIELREGKDLINTASIDSITGLYSGQFFVKFSGNVQEDNPDTPMDIGVLNISRFRSFNELYGRVGGNTLLRAIGSALRQYIQDVPGVAARAEADSFYLFFPHTDNYEPLLEMVQDAVRTVPNSAPIRVRIGICPSTHDLSIAKRLDRARTACNMLRDNYNSSLMVYDDRVYAAEQQDERLTNDLDRAITEHQFLVYYQPKYRIQGDTPRLNSAEALIRWKHPELGMISPGKFIPLFERSGLIHIVDHYVWKEAARQIADWKQCLGVTVPISVNLSRQEIYDAGLEQTLMDLVNTNHLSPEDLLLEVTESAYVDNSDDLLQVVQRLRRKGFKIEMDDFGSGYSSLNMLSTLPVDALKMDMKFIQNVRENNRDFRMIELILDIAEYIGVPVIAEGVEDEEQLRLLKDAGCAFVQGYYFSKPVPAEEFEALIRKDLETRKE
ncbi:MAG: EAL domain-containing protein [Solobacterium sp.]|nr:EAL domain-containing protein [Solobacterium sp.]